MLLVMTGFVCSSSISNPLSSSATAPAQIPLRSLFYDLSLLFVSTAHTLHICLVNGAINAGFINTLLGPRANVKM